jgi:hypothetical protein
MGPPELVIKRNQGHPGGTYGIWASSPADPAQAHKARGRPVSRPDALSFGT